MCKLVILHRKKRVLQQNTAEEKETEMESSVSQPVQDHSLLMLITVTISRETPPPPSVDPGQDPISPEGEKDEGRRDTEVERGKGWMDKEGKGCTDGERTERKKGAELRKEQ